MGEHGTWFDFLYRIEGFGGFVGDLQQSLGRGWKWMMFGDSVFTLTHVFVALTVMLIIIYGSMRFYAGVRGGGTAALVPPTKLNARNFFEILCDAVYGLCTSVMGEKNGKRFFPFIGALWFFILFCNLFALVPGFAPATDTLKTNVALALLVFFATHVYGVKEHGLAYFKHFMGPIWWLSWLILPIELISHLARPVSLSLRLMGNMVADHKVVFAFFAMVPVIVPVPFLLLGILVCVVQTLVFCLLSMVYISMAVSHDH